MENRRLAAIMFTDIVGYTRLMGSDEDKAFKVLENNRALHKDLLILYDGQLLKEIGDGMLCSFDSASKAVKCGIELIRKSNEYKDLKLRIGIHVGEVVFSGNDVFGDGVNIASRIESMAIADSVLISEQVYEQIKNKQNIRVKHIGTYELKNDTKPREIYAIANTRMKVPAGKELHSYVEDKPELQKIPTQSSNQQKTPSNKKRIRLSTPRVGLTLIFSLMAVAFGSFLFISFKNSKNIRWANDELLPEVERLMDSVSTAAGVDGSRANTFKAFEVADQAKEYIGEDKRLNDLLDRISNYKSITTEPTQASVYIKSYHDQNGQWKLLGLTPLDSVRLPLGMIRIKIEKEGFDAIEDLIRNTKRTGSEFAFKLPAAGSVPEGMVYCQASQHHIDGEWLELDAYYMDKYEVTNDEYRKFIAEGGYQKQEYWKYPIVGDTDTIPWRDAMQLFRDQSNQPGPSTWIAGDFPEGKGNHPVTGISWYEASAYAAYHGKQLPSRYHFGAAAMEYNASDILPFANFSNTDSRKVGNGIGSLHRFGLYDLAGNAREWAFNVHRRGGRLLLGGGWNDYDYVFPTQGDRSSDPLNRNAANGFRCIQFIHGQPDVRFFQEYGEPITNQPQIKLVSDTEFKTILNNYEYDHTPLNAVTEYSRVMEEWTKQKITFNTAYGNERMSVYLFLPKNIKPPYQCVLYHPGTGAQNYRTSEGNIGIDRLDFIVKTGRAALFPVFKGMYERNDWYEKTANNAPDGAYKDRDELIMRGKDLKRSVDYLETRGDIDMGKIVYFGLSWGGMNGPSMIAIEPRFKACVLVLAGLRSTIVLPEIDGVSYLPRVTIPTLMLNGRYDMSFPLETSSKPFFNLLGTPPEYKKMILYNEGHSIPRNEMIKESLNWLDTYLGPVEPGS